MSVTTTVGLDFMLGSITGQARLENMIESATGGGASKGLTGAVKSTAKKLESAFGDAYINSIRLGAKEEAKQLQASFKEREKRIKRAAGLQQKMEEKLERIKDQAGQGRRAHNLRERIAATKKIIRAQQDGQDKLISDMAAAQKDQLALLDEGMKQSAKSFGDKLESGADNFSSIMSQALSAENLNVGDLVKNIGGALKDAAPSMVKFGAKQGGKSGMMGGLGKVIGKLGAAAGVIAGVAAAVGAVIALFMAAYGQTKEFNKAILEGASAVDLLSGNALSNTAAFANELGDLRTAAIDVALEFRYSAEQALGLANEMNRAGLTYKEQRSLFGNYTESIELALKATQSFGVGGGEVAGMLETMTKNMGLQLQGIEDGFSKIFAGAQMSGMGVASFFTSISEATSGMALMNFRLEDTVELLLGMEKILGEDLAKEQLGGLRGKYADMGFQERYKTTMLAGASGGRIIGAAATRQGAGYMDKLNEALDNMKVGDRKKAREQLSQVRNADGTINMAGLGALKGQDLGVLQNTMAALGPEFEQLARQLGDMSQLARGVDTTSTGRRAAALGSLDESSTLAFSMVSALGDRAIGDMEGVDRMAFEEQTGISGQQFEQYQEIFNRLAGRMTAGEEGFEKFKGKEITTSMVAEVIAAGDMLSPEDKAALGAAQEAGMSEMETLAQMQLKETTSILQTLKNEVVSILNSINGWVESVSSLFGVDSKQTRKQDAAEMAQQFGDRQAALDREREAAEEKGDFSKAAEFDLRQEKITEGSALAREVSRSGDVEGMQELRTMMLEAAGVTLGPDGVMSGLGIVTGQNPVTFTDFEGNAVDDPLTVGGWSQQYGYEGVLTSGVPIYAGTRERSTHYPKIDGVPTGIGYGGRMVTSSDLDPSQITKIADWHENRQVSTYWDDPGAGATGNTLGGIPLLDLDALGMDLSGGEADVITAWLDKELPEQSQSLEGIESEGKKTVTGLAGVESAVNDPDWAGQLFLAEAGVVGDDEVAARARMKEMAADPAYASYMGAYKEYFEAQYGKSYDDFIYRGSGGPGGTIHPINGRDVVGALPESWSAMGGGGNVTITNLTIHESGDANKTFAMVKAAIKAAKV